MILPIIFLSSSYFAFASTPNNSTNEYDSMYRYSALENKTSFSNTTNTKDISAEKLPEVAEPLNITVKEFRDIIKKQNSSTEKTNNLINTSANRSGLKTFLIGNNLGILRFQLVQIKDEASLLEALALKTEYSAYILQIDNQFKLLKKEQVEVEDLILKQEGEFSLFGWFVKML